MAATAEEAPSSAEEELQMGEELTLEEIDQQLNNPLTSLWSLTFQENYSLLDGDALNGTESGNNFFFQPSLPVPVKDLVVIARPVFPLVTSPVPDPDYPGEFTGRTTGFGDMQLFTAVGPSRLTGRVIGVGATFKFPTASSDLLGEGKYQLKGRRKGQWAVDVDRNWRITFVFDGHNCTEVSYEDYH